MKEGMKEGRMEGRDKGMERRCFEERKQKGRDKKV